MEANDKKWKTLGAKVSIEEYRKVKKMAANEDLTISKFVKKKVLGEA